MIHTIPLCLFYDVILHSLFIHSNRFTLFGHCVNLVRSLVHFIQLILVSRMSGNFAGEPINNAPNSSGAANQQSTSQLIPCYLCLLLLLRSYIHSLPTPFVILPQIAFTIRCPHTFELSSIPHLGSSCDLKGFFQSEKTKTVLSIVGVLSACAVIAVAIIAFFGSFVCTFVSSPSVSTFAYLMIDSLVIS